MVGFVSLSAHKRYWIYFILFIFIGGMWLFDLKLTMGMFGIILLCFFCELMDSSLGMGYGTTLTPVLLMFGFKPLDLVPTILLSEFLSGFAASYFHHETGNVNFLRGSRDFWLALLLALGSVLGVSIGVNLAMSIPAKLLKLFIGVIIFGCGLLIWILINRTILFKSWKMFLIASVASFNKALSGGGYGPLLTSGQILSGVESRASVGITSFAEGFTCLVGVILFLGKGQMLNPELMIPVICGAQLSVPFSAELVKSFNEKALKKTIAVVTMILGAFTLYKAIF